MSAARGMDDVWQLVIAGFTGLLSGFLVSMPIGPINISVINEGAQRGFARALWIGLGAMTMDVIYCAIGLAGFSELFSARLLRAGMELASFVLVLSLGVKYLRAQSLTLTSKGADLIEQRLHPHTAYMTGLARVVGNPGVLLLWVALSAMFVSHEWVDPNWMSKLLCVVGVGVGATIWFLLLSYGVSRGHRRFSTGTLLKLSRISGACLLAVSIIIAGRIVALLAKH